MGNITLFRKFSLWQMIMIAAIQTAVFVADAGDKIFKFVPASAWLRTPIDVVINAVGSISAIEFIFVFLKIDIIFPVLYLIINIVLSIYHSKKILPDLSETAVADYKKRFIPFAVIFMILFLIAVAMHVFWYLGMQAIVAAFNARD